MIQKRCGNVASRGTCPVGLTACPPAVTSATRALTMLPLANIPRTMDRKLSPYGPVTVPKSAAEMYCRVWYT